MLQVQLSGWKKVPQIWCGCARQFKVVVSVQPAFSVNLAHLYYRNKHMHFRISSIIASSIKVDPLSGNALASIESILDPDEITGTSGNTTNLHFLNRTKRS